MLINLLIVNSLIRFHGIKIVRAIERPGLNLPRGS